MIRNFKGTNNRAVYSNPVSNGNGFFEKLTSHLPVGLAFHEIILDDYGKPLDYYFLEANPEFERISGLKREDIIGKRVLEIFPQTGHQWIERCGKVALTGESDSFEHSIPGTDQVYSVTAYCYKKNHFAVIVDDISERYQIREKLRENSAILKIAGKSAKFGSWTVDLEAEYINWSAEVAEMFGRKEGNSPSFKDAIDFFAPDFRQKVIEIFRLCSEKGISFEEELEIMKTSEVRTWIRITGEAIRDKHGRIIKLQGSIQDIDQLKTTEKKMEESRQALARLISNLPGVAYRCKNDKEWTMEFISTGCLQMTGYADYEFYLNEISWNKLIVESDREFVRIEINRCIENRMPFQFEYRIRNRTGRNKWVWEKGIGIYDKYGNPTGIEGFITDITERRSTEDALAESTRNYKDLIDGMNETVWIIDLEGNIVDVNKTAVDFLGYTKEELISIGLKGIDSFLDNEKIALLINNMPAARFQIFETSHRSKSGKVYPVEIYSSLVNYRGKKSILSIARDISRRKRDEKIQFLLFDIAKSSTNADAIESLLETFHDRFLEILDASDMYLALYDNDTCTLHEIKRKDGAKRKEWKVENSLPGLVFKSGRMLNLTHKNGLRLINNKKIVFDSEFPLLWLGLPLKENGDIIGVLVVESMNDKPYDDNTLLLLQTIAHELCVVIQKKRMIQDLINAKNKAEESDRLKTAFLANISHEIRTPMNGILGFLDLLRIPDLDENRKEKFIELVNVSGQRLLETINIIIESAKIEAGQVDVDYGNVNLAEIMLYQYDFFQQQALLKSLKFELKEGVRGASAMIRTDKYKLNAILTNLLNNAFKFTKQGSIVFGNYLQNDQIIFYVSDTGIGIPAEKINKIFERFIQGDSNITRPYEGSGLGLSIVKAYVEMLNGRIWVNSKPGTGSNFFISIPFIPVIYHHYEGQEDNAGERTCLKKLKILIAEDDQISYEYLKAILNNGLFELLHTTNGIDTVNTVRDNPDISVVLMDIKMPGISGLDAARKIREFNITVPIIAQSAHAFDRDKIKAVEAGCNDYLSKPVSRADLLSMISNYTKNNLPD